MRDADRFQLYFGPYKTPRFKYGQRVLCEYRGWMKIVGLTDAKVPWPIGRPTRRNAGRDSLIIFRGLKKAVERESNQAVAHWWGVSMHTVTRWRRALDVGRKTPGTERTTTASLKAPSRRAKIAASRRGKRMPKRVIAALRKANRGRPFSAEHRRKLSIAQKRRRARPPWINDDWSANELRLLRKLTPAEVTKRTGRTLTAVYLRRRKLGLPPTHHVTHAGRTQSIPDWAGEIGITPEALRYRLKRMPVAQALTTPKQK